MDPYEITAISFTVEVQFQRRDPATGSLVPAAVTGITAAALQVDSSLSEGSEFLVSVDDALQTSVSTSATFTVTAIPTWDAFCGQQSAGLSLQLAEGTMEASDPTMSLIPSNVVHVSWAPGSTVLPEEPCLFPPPYQPPPPPQQPPPQVFEAEVNFVAVFSDLDADELLAENDVYETFVSDFISSVLQELPAGAVVFVVKIIKGSVIVVSSVNLPSAADVAEVEKILLADSGNQVLQTPQLEKYGSSAVDVNRVVSVVQGPPSVPPLPQRPPQPPLAPGQQAPPLPPAPPPLAEVSIIFTMEFPLLPDSILLEDEFLEEFKESYVMALDEDFEGNAKIEVLAVVNKTVDTKITFSAAPAVWQDVEAAKEKLSSPGKMVSLATSPEMLGYGPFQAVNITTQILSPPGPNQPSSPAAPPPAAMLPFWELFQSPPPASPAPPADTAQRKGVSPSIIAASVLCPAGALALAALIYFRKRFLRQRVNPNMISEEINAAGEI